jgi:hypothetical protein
MEFSIIEDNPFLTKSGEYSFELELSLREAVNAKIFNHIARFNRKDDQASLSAILMADNRVCMRGTAVILGHTDISVKIQLLSGNSELNYFIGADMKIEDLDLGEEPAITKSKALDSLTKCYPESNYVCAPVIADNGAELNRYRYWSKAGEEAETISKIAMMPYLLYYVQKIPEALGYAVVENQLPEDILFQRLYIPNSKKTLRYGEILPGWTVRDFLIEIEKFCNAVFVIDKEKSSVRIVRFYNWEKSSEKVYIDEIADEYEEEYDSENETDTVNYERVAYAFPADKYYNYKRLSDDVLENTVIEEYDTFQDLSTALTPPADYYNKNKIYHVKKHFLFGFFEIESDNYYIVRDLGNNHYCFDRVNDFCDVGKKDGNTIELKIIPAKMGVYIYPDYLSDCFLQAPVVPEIKEDEEDEGEKKGVIDLIESGVSDSESEDTIPVAIYMGKLNLSGPWSQTDCYMNMAGEAPGVYGEEIAYTGTWNLIPWGQLEPDIKNELLNEFLYYLKYTLRLSGEYGSFKNNYSINKNMSSKIIRKIYFIPKGKINPQNLFVINNREFFCISLETKFNNRGALPVVEGKFYPVE